jgi:hypothetical protein
MGKDCHCGKTTVSDFICLECLKPICRNCTVRTSVPRTIRRFHRPCRDMLGADEDSWEEIRLGLTYLTDRVEPAWSMGEGTHSTKSERLSQQRELLNSSNNEDRIKSIKGVEELWFRNHDAEALALYEKGLRDRSPRVKIAFLTNYPELFLNRNNLEKRLEFIRDIRKNPIVQILLSTISRLCDSKNQDIKKLALICLLITMEVISPGFEKEYKLTY